MSFNKELYYDYYDAMLGITKKQKDAEEEATRKILDDRELKFRKDSEDPQVRYNYSMREENQSPKKQNSQKRENIAELYSSTLNATIPQFTTAYSTPQAGKDGQFTSGSTNFNGLNNTFKYSYSDYLSGDKSKQNGLESYKSGNTLKGTTLRDTTPLSIQDSFNLSAKAKDLMIKTEEGNNKALKEIEKKINNRSSTNSAPQEQRSDQTPTNMGPVMQSNGYLNPQNSEYDLLFNYKDGIFTNAFKPNDDIIYPSYLPEQQNINNNQTKKDDGYDLEKALEHLRSNAKPKSTKECGKHVRDAIAAGGVTDPTGYKSAKDYIGLMPKLGFTQMDSKSYTPRAGDVVIHDENGINHPDGHAAMFDGEKWISDFVQTDMYGGSAYRNNPNYTLWRR